MKYRRATVLVLLVILGINSCRGTPETANAQDEQEHTLLLSSVTGHPITRWASTSMEILPALGVRG